jgi:hypothetical protein
MSWKVSRRHIGFKDLLIVRILQFCGCCNDVIYIYNLSLNYCCLPCFMLLVFHERLCFVQGYLPITLFSWVGEKAHGGYGWSTGDAYLSWDLISPQPFPCVLLSICIFIRLWDWSFFVIITFVILRTYLTVYKTIESKSLVWDCISTMKLHCIKAMAQWEHSQLVPKIWCGMPCCLSLSVITSAWDVKQYLK